jgi:thiaminase/transcriptional activator TenA
MVSAEENTYFLRAFEALGVSEARRAADPDTQATIGFKAIMREAADTRSYVAALSVLVVAEWLYLDWASRAPQPLPNNFVHAEWITLHDNPNFRGFVDFLRAELDRVGPAHADGSTRRRWPCLVPAAANSADSSAASVISAGNGQLNPALASRFNVNRTVDGATPTRRAISLSPTPAVLNRSTSRTWRIVVLSAGIRSPVQKPKERTLIGPAEAPLN